MSNMKCFLIRNGRTGQCVVTMTEDRALFFSEIMNVKYDEVHFDDSEQRIVVGSHALSYVGKQSNITNFTGYGQQQFPPRTARRPPG